MLLTPILIVFLSSCLWITAWAEESLFCFKLYEAYIRKIINLNGGFGFIVNIVDIIDDNVVKEADGIIHIGIFSSITIIFSSEVNTVLRIMSVGKKKVIFLKNFFPKVNHR